MGEAADDAIDRGMDEWLSGEYDDDDPGFNYGLSLRSCRYCKASGLHWEMSRGQWRLFTEQREMHTCATKMLFR
jgi:hypothetical protein